MSRKFLFLTAAALAAGALAVGVASAQDGPPPPPTSGVVLAEGLSATGSAIGPDGALYVPVGGTGGDQVLEPPPDAGIEGEVTFGLSASIVRVDPDTGDTTTVAENLPSLAFDGEGGSIADVEFNGATMYFLVTGSADKLGVAEWPNGVYRVTSGGEDSDLVTNLSAFNDANPVDFPDAIPGGNPFALERRGTGFIVSDGNYNRLVSIDASGNASLLSQFENVVPTGLAAGSGPVLNTWFSAAPHLPGDSHVVGVGVPSGTVTQLASGPASMIDVSIGPNGNTYVLQFSDYTADETAPPTPTGRIYQLQGTTLTLLVDGFILPTSLNFEGNTAYVTSLIGNVWQIENFSSIAPLPAPAPTTAPPPAPAPTATPGTGPIGAPDTGFGDGGSGDGTSSAWIIVGAMALGGVALAAAGTRAARNRG